MENSIQIARSDIVPRNDGLLPVNNLVDAIVGMVRCFRDLKGDDGSVRTSSTEKGISQEKRVGHMKATYPLEPIPMASWKVSRRDSCTSSPHSPPSNKLV